MNPTPAPIAERTLPLEWRSFPARAGLPPGYDAWWSEALSDPQWDAFLLGTPLGQFQQSSAWGRIKGFEGWRAVRFLVTRGAGLVGGFQVLWRAKRGVRLGYVTKGPVVVDNPHFTLLHAFDLVKQAAAQLGLEAVIVQPPDLAVGAEAGMAAVGYLANRLQTVISAAVWVDLARSWAAVEAGFSPRVLREIQKVRAAGWRTRFGEKAECEHFFGLMRETCVRQQVAPNPAHPDLVRAILREFQPLTPGVADPCARLLFAEKDGLTGPACAGLLLLRFGNRLTLWKRGSAPTGLGKWWPTKLLDYDAMRWGQLTGCDSYDTAGLDRAAAEAVLRGRPLGQIPMRFSDQYKLRFGGQVRLLPESAILVRRSALRLAYRLYLRFRPQPRPPVPPSEGEGE